MSPSFKMAEHPIEIDSTWITDEQLERLDGGILSVRFSVAEKRVLRKKKAIRPAVWAERQRYRALACAEHRPGPFDGRAEEQALPTPGSPDCIK